MPIALIVNSSTEEEYLHSLSTSLVRRGYEVQIDEHGEKIRAHRDPDVVILDVDVPGGWDALSELVAADIPVIVVASISISAGDVVRGLKAGAENYLTKLCHGNEVAALADRAYERSQEPLEG